LANKYWTPNAKVKANYLTMFDDTIINLAKTVNEQCKSAGLRLAIAESCTGGLVCGALTAIAGSSAILERGIVAYSNETKAQELAVSYDLIKQHGAVSKPVALSMAEGILARSYPYADLSVSLTGVAGPGGTAGKPAGLVHFAAARRGASESLHKRCDFGDIGRKEVRRMAIITALELVIARIQTP